MRLWKLNPGRLYCTASRDLPEAQPHSQYSGIGWMVGLPIPEPPPCALLYPFLAGFYSLTWFHSPIKTRNLRARLESPPLLPFLTKSYSFYPPKLDKLSSHNFYPWALPAPNTNLFIDSSAVIPHMATWMMASDISSSLQKIHSGCCMQLTVQIP